MIATLTEIAASITIIVTPPPIIFTIPKRAEFLADLNKSTSMCSGEKIKNIIANNMALESESITVTTVEEMNERIQIAIQALPYGKALCAIAAPPIIRGCWECIDPKAPSAERADY